jgi:hypothetical protein
MIKQKNLNFCENSHIGNIQNSGMLQAQPKSQLWRWQYNDYYFDVSWQKVLLQGSIFRGKKVILQQNIFGSNLA